MFTCSNCSKEYSKWQGKCEGCNEWNTIVEIAQTVSPKSSRSKTKLNFKDVKTVKLSDIPKAVNLRKMISGIKEFDNTVGGGIISGQVILLSGEPGAGKSTLALHLLEALSKQGIKSLYVAGEESPEQIKHRADRLGLVESNAEFLQETNIELIENYVVSKIKNFDLILIDSIQTLYSTNVSSSSGSVSQVSECTDRLTNIAKGYGVPIILIGHVTKTGNIAGPKILEHMVDTVLYFEGDKKYEYRMLRVEKNRYGSTDEVGLFKMTEKGLKEINDEKELYNPQSKDNIGSSFSIALEGNRPIVVEVQVLATKSYFEIPRRTTSGFDKSRLHIILAIADKILKLKTYQYDIYVNLTGGFSIKDPALDLAVLKALISSIKNIPVSSSIAYLGEVGLTGEIRKVFMQEKRIKEAKRLGFQKVLSSNECKRVVDV